MRMNLLSRLKKLDARFAPNRPMPTFRYGWLTTLPEDFTGERHVAVVTKPPANSVPGEPWEFEERPGPDQMKIWTQGIESKSSSGLGTEPATSRRGTAR